ncbi:MAG: hypothetical protein P4L81_08325 [Candidatus Pacebacteria bacterium]|nr:hypothetical protein [Candidatus Paceibacterota bacterium]
MNKKGIVVVIIGIIVLVGIASLLLSSFGSTSSTSATTSTQTQTQTQASTTASVSSSTVPLMSSTGVLFTQYKNYSKAHEIFPTLASDTKKAMGAFGYTQTDLGNNTYKITLTNKAENYSGQSVIVTAGQSVYFIEPATGDDSATEDSITTDDSLVAVDAQGYMLQ